MENTASIKKELNNYKMVDVLKYAAAIMVICIHCGQLVSPEFLNFFIKDIVCRIAVPIFFISGAYFIRKGCQKDPCYLKTYLKSSTKSYLAWSVVFIPIGLDWLYQNLSLSGIMLPLALVFGLVHVGTYYHLWYIPAMIFSLFLVNWLLKRFSYKVVFFLSVLLFLFGSLETYYGLLPGGWFKDFFDAVIAILFTTRSGLLFGMVFTAIGFFVYDYREKLQALLKYVPLLTLLSGGLLVAEGFLLYNIPKLDMNFLLMLIPFGFFFFLWILSLRRVPKFDTRKIRELSKYYYFIHPISIVIVEEIGKAFHWNILSSGIVSFLLILLLTHVLCLAVISVQRQPLKHSLILLAALCGMVVTFLFSGLLYQFKPDGVLVKFELVTCLWVFTSFGMYALLFRRKRYKATHTE